VQLTQLVWFIRIFVGCKYSNVICRQSHRCRPNVARHLSASRPISYSVTNSSSLVCGPAIALCCTANNRKVVF